MAIKFEKIQPGMVLLDIHKQQMGNTTISAWGLWEVYVVSVDLNDRSAMCRWNGNKEKRFTEHQLTRLYTKKTKAYLAQEERRKNGNRF